MWNTADSTSIPSAISVRRLRDQTILVEVCRPHTQQIVMMTSCMMVRLQSQNKQTLHTVRYIATLWHCDVIKTAHCLIRDVLTLLAWASTRRRRRMVSLCSSHWANVWMNRDCTTLYNGPSSCVHDKIILTLVWPANSNLRQYKYIPHKLKLPTCLEEQTQSCLDSSPLADSSGSWSHKSHTHTHSECTYRNN